MKKWILTICALFTGICLLAQGNVTTRKYRLADFTDKITQVVLTGNEVLSSALRQEVVSGWTASAFEFCTLEQFEKLKTSDNYYFLIAAETRFKDEDQPGITFLTLVKGGPEASEGIGAMHEVISLPLQAAMGGDGRELVYLGSLVSAVQDFTLAAMESEKVAYSRDTWFRQNYDKWGKMKQIYMAREDIVENMQEQDIEKLLDPDWHVCPAEESDRQYLDGAYHVLTSYVVAPVIPSKGSYCYKMLFEADTHTLFYLSRHKITEKKGVGFLPEDLKYLARKR